jgi:hypothetical protein
MHTALRSTSQTLRGFLSDCFEAAPDLRPFFDSGSGGSMKVALVTPQEMIDNSFEGVSVWLYRVVRDDQRLNSPPERVGRNQIKPPPLPMRLHYLVTPMTASDTAGGSETEQVLLGKVLQLLHDKPQLRGSDLRDDFVGTDVELHVRLETMTLEEITRVWEAIDASYQLSVSYEVSVVNIDSAIQPESIAPVMVTLPEHMVRLAQP